MDRCVCFAQPRTMIQTIQKEKLPKCHVGRGRVRGIEAEYPKLLKSPAAFVETETQSIWQCLKQEVLKGTSYRQGVCKAAHPTPEYAGLRETARDQEGSALSSSFRQ